MVPPVVITKSMFFSMHFRNVIQSFLSPVKVKSLKVSPPIFKVPDIGREVFQNVESVLTSEDGTLNGVYKKDTTSLYTVCGRVR